MPSFGQAATALLSARDFLGLSRLTATSYANVDGNTHHQMSSMHVSDLGTNLADLLPDFRRDNPLPDGFPWGNKDSKNTNYYDAQQDTGVTRYYDWTVTKEKCAPDGVEIDCVLVNSQFPGPAIHANWGDWVEVKVRNNLSDEGTAVHWHGFLQKGTQFMDGVPGYDQCPIAPGKELTYRFKADLYGSSWWHSHYSAQYGSGMVGPMVVYGPKNSDYDKDLGPIMAMDWYHEYYEEAIDGLFQPIPNFKVPRAKSNTINGKGSFPCEDTDMDCTPNMPLASFNLTSGKTHRLRLINPSSVATQKITLDHHTFKVIANDFVEIEPYETDVITIGVGQRSDVLVYANGTSNDAVYLRAYRPADCAVSDGNEEIKATFYYENADRSKLPITPPGPNAYNNYCGNDDLSMTQPTLALEPGEPSVTENLPIELKSNGTHLVWYMANQTFRVNYNDPILLDANQGQREFPEIYNVHNYGNNDSIRFIVQNTGVQVHPMHVHGHNMFVLAEGVCADNSTVFNETSVAPPERKRQAGSGMMGETMSRYGSCWDGHITNPDNPQRRDVQNLVPGGYIVVQWKQDNPGIWPFHCHIAWHLSAGFVWTVMEQPDAIENQMNIPPNMAETCRDWDAWSNRNVVDQIDDGL